MTEKLDSIITLTGIKGADWDKHVLFSVSGTINELKEYFTDNIATGYKILVNSQNQPITTYRQNNTYKNLVPYEFYTVLGTYILNNLEAEDIIKISGTLETNNKFLEKSGVSPVEPGHFLYEFWNTITTDNFWDAEITEKIACFRDHSKHSSLQDLNESTQRVRDAAAFCTANNYMKKHLNSPVFAEKYPQLNYDVMQIWKTEVCKKSIYPFLNSLEQKYNLSGLSETNLN